jgi:WD40 repeat protein
MTLCGSLRLSASSAFFSPELLAKSPQDSTLRLVTFSPDGQRLASADASGAVKVWEAGSGQELHAYKGHTRQVTDVAFSPDGWRLASASEDHTAKVWDARNSQESRAFHGENWGEATTVTFSPDSQRLPVGESTLVRLGDVPTGLELLRLEGANPDYSRTDMQMT